MEDLTPKQIVEELDRHIVGQGDAKRKVAIALRNRWRRQQLSADLRDEVAPKNIIMIGPTGVGKTEIARRLSKLVDAPFVKVEASKFTEVGYVGRDCESMIRELADVAVNLVKEERKAANIETARAHAENRILDLLLPPASKTPQKVFNPLDPASGDEGPARVTPEESAERRTRDMLRQKLRAGELDEREVEIEMRETGQTSMMQMFGASGLEEMGVNLQEMLGRFMPNKTRRRKTTVADARRLLEQEELENLLDMDAVVSEAIRRTEDAGIVFLDEIDKIASRGGGGAGGQGPDVSREGVQRDILPIVEGSTVTTKYGTVKTDHILFIAAGAFHMTKVSDLIPELQGRFPIRVELDNLEAKDFSRILREPKSSLIRQYQALLAAEGVTLDFSDEAIEEMARICQQINQSTENIGARRLHTIMEYLLEDLSYNAPDYAGRSVMVNEAFVKDRLVDIQEERDLGRYIL